ncbi:hypothetical protein UVI_02014850 [Ustilaginoidea virens]|uniref:SAP domain-containing protein n=1 Tax=Ustilaginoidea virens TaxID=1159556 RepID=A0A1B5L660_USTVR|nr:hypothetical protein UVI_02014850 [Ustilaginoidea virens]
MTDYNSLKVPDLKGLLGRRKLQQSGNKQALIARLQEDDDKIAAAAKLAAARAAAAKAGTAARCPSDVTGENAPRCGPPPGSALRHAEEDQVSYSDGSDDEAAPPETAGAKPVSAAEPKPAAAAPASKKNKDATRAPTSAGEPTEADVAAPSYAIGLASSAADEEAIRRAERAKRFGIEQDDEARQRAERAKRFGLAQNDLASGLDSALPDRPLKRGRGARGDGEGIRPFKRYGGNRQRVGGVLDDAAERAKADKRAARFATA